MSDIKVSLEVCFVLNGDACKSADLAKLCVRVYSCNGLWGMNKNVFYEIFFFSRGMFDMLLTLMMEHKTHGKLFMWGLDGNLITEKVEQSFDFHTLTFIA